MTIPCGRSLTAHRRPRIGERRFLGRGRGRVPVLIVLPQEPSGLVPCSRDRHRAPARRAGGALGRRRSRPRRWSRADRGRAGDGRTCRPGHRGPVGSLPHRGARQASANPWTSVRLAATSQPGPRPTTSDPGDVALRHPACCSRRIARPGNLLSLGSEERHFTAQRFSTAFTTTTSLKLRPSTCQP